jgi:hypothetical protein
MLLVLEKGFLIEDDVILTVAVAVMVFDGTILLWIATPFETEWKATADPSSMKASVDELVQ